MFPAIQPGGVLYFPLQVENLDHGWRFQKEEPRLQQCDSKTFPDYLPGLHGTGIKTNFIKHTLHFHTFPQYH